MALRAPLFGMLVTGSLAASATSAAAVYSVGPMRHHQTLKDVAPLLRPGDVVEVDGDHVYPGDVVLKKGGSESAKVVLRGLRRNGKRPVLSGGKTTLELRGDHVVVEGFEITAGSERCLFHHAHDVLVKDTLVRDCPSHGILGADSSSGSLTLSYVEVRASGRGDQKHPIYIATDETAHPRSVFRMEHCYVHDGRGGNNVKSRAERNEIYSNWIEGASSHALELIGPDGQPPELAREDSDVVGNVFIGTRDTYMVRVGGDGTGETGGHYRFVNNTFIASADSTRAVIRAFHGVGSLAFYGNVFYRTGGQGLVVLTDADARWSTGRRMITGSDNWVVTGSTAAPPEWQRTLFGTDPGFSGPRDPRPVKGSPLVDAGAAETPEPAGFEVKNALRAPEYLPPAGAAEPLGAAKRRKVVRRPDAGAFEYEH